jgi:hypothetical protein
VVHLKDYVVRDAAVFGLAILRIGIHGCLVVKPVAILIEKVFIVAKVKTERENVQLRKSVQFIGLGNAVVVLVDPQDQVLKHRVPLVDDSVTVAAVFRLIKLRQCQESVGIGGFRLFRDVAK